MSPKYEGNCLYCIHLLCKEGRIRGEVYVGHINVMPLDPIFNILCLYFLILFMAWYQYGRQDPLPYSSLLSQRVYTVQAVTFVLVFNQTTTTSAYYNDCFLYCVMYVCMYPCNNFFSFIFFIAGSITWGAVYTVKTVSSLYMYSI